jgi:hypothetical protein
MQMEFWKAENPKIKFNVDIILSNRTWMMFCPSFDSSSDEDENGSGDQAAEPDTGTGDEGETDEATRALATTTIKPTSLARIRGHASRLWPYTRVRAAVRALNGQFGGPLSNTIEFRTPEGGSFSLSVSEQSPGKNCCIKRARPYHTFFIKSIYVNHWSSDAWNYLPSNLRHAPSTSAFKKAVKCIDLSSFLEGASVRQ